MATTIKQIAQYLSNRNWKYMVDGDNYSIFTGVKADSIKDFLIVIQLDEEGKFLRFCAPRLLSDAHKHEHRELIFRTLLALAWNHKMLQWESNLIDGEVRAVIELPLEDAPLTEKQFNRCLSSLIYLVDAVAMPRIKEVMATGIDPGERELGEQLLLMLQEVVPTGVLDLLESALMTRRSGWISI